MTSIPAVPFVSEKKKIQAPTRAEILACQFTSWYPEFRSVTIRSIIIPLEDAFIRFILSDGIKLPSGTNVSSCAKFHLEEDCSWSSDDNEDDDDDNYCFPELNAKIEEAIRQLGGAVMPKLNWSAPKDGTWINEGSMKCQTPGDVYILLKSSDFCSHDLLYAFSNCEEQDQADSVPYHLILRKWCNLHVSMEFRCFVTQRKLAAVSQREHTQYYPYLKNEKDSILDLIVNFYLRCIRPKFLLQKFVFDCYVDKNQKVFLIDFNVWGQSTDSLLYDWEELNDYCFSENHCTIFRLVENEGEVRHNPLASYRAPIDAIDLASDSLGANSFEEFISFCSKNQK